MNKEKYLNAEKFRSHAKFNGFDMQNFEDALRNFLLNEINPEIKILHYKLNKKTIGCIYNVSGHKKIFSDTLYHPYQNWGIPGLQRNKDFLSRIDYDIARKPVF